MPSYVKNTGMSSLNELFAMKKNLAYETKFEHKLSGLAKDYFHKKENLKQEIITVYNELKTIKTSTGYSLKESQSETSNNRIARRPTIPTIYLPPIGVRLVKKYVGIDVKRHSLAGDASPSGQQPNLESILNRTIGFNKRHSVDKPIVEISKMLEPPEIKQEEIQKKLEHQVSPVEILGQTEDLVSQMECVEKVEQLRGQGAEETEFNNRMKEEKTEELIIENVKQNMNITQSDKTPDPVQDGTKLTLPFIMMTENPTDETITFKASGEVEAKSGKAGDVEQNINESKGYSSDDGTVFIETRYNLTERRSSRSTFRGRSSARLPSRSSVLSEYNRNVLALSSEKGNKASVKKFHGKGKTAGNFYLDYGDGILHDCTEIPKIKDCSRPWCNPHCKTCRNRTFSRPCFVLIPADDNRRRRKLPVDKRVRTMFPVHLSSIKSETDGKDENTENIEAITEDKKSKEINADKVDCDENANTGADPTAKEENKNKEDENYNQIDLEVEKVLQIKSTRQKKGYSKIRMLELSQPRGGPPAEVRFSKMSLRKQQEELIEDERRKALTEFERENLANIQARISLFLALLNEKEIKGKPVKMVDIPIRMDVNVNDISKNKHNKKKRRRNVHFNQRARLLS